LKNAIEREWQFIQSLLLASTSMVLAISANASDYLLAAAPASCPPVQTAPAQSAKVTSPAPKPEPISAQTRARFFVSAKDAVAGSKQALIVDVRLGQDVGKLWIPDAIHLLPEFLSTNALVQSAETVFLVDDGKDESRLLHSVEGLQTKQKNPLRIVSGGVPAWYRAGGATAGNVALLDAPAILEAKEFHDLVMQRATIAVIGKPSAEERKAFPKLVELPADTTLRAGIASLQGRVIQQSPTVILLRSADKAAEWNKAWLDAFHQAPYLFVDAGNRYTGFLEQQKQIAANANKPLQHRCDVR